MPAFDIDTPSPDDGHEAIRVAVVEAIADLRENTAGVGDAYWLTDLLFDLLGSALVAIDDLTARLAALEPAVFASPPEETP